MSKPTRPGGAGGAAEGGDEGSRSNRVGREMVLAGAPDIPVWYSQPETGGTFGAVTSAGGIFTGDLTAAEFAQKVQASIKPNKKA